MGTSFCEGKFTKHECLKVSEGIILNETLGNGGFTIEPALGDLLAKVLNETYEKGELTES